MPFPTGSSSISTGSTSATAFTSAPSRCPKECGRRRPSAISRSPRSAPPRRCAKRRPRRWRRPGSSSRRRRLPAPEPAAAARRAMRLIVGLGNPGARYARNRHNIGFVVADAVARRWQFSPYRSRFKGELAEGTIAGERRLLLKPQTFMNDSGEAVLAAMSFFKIPPGDIVVVHDELDLKPGKVRVKRGGGNAGHNGLRSIDALIGPDYWRIRIGIGHPGVRDLVMPYVLQNFAADEVDGWVAPVVDAVAETLPLVLAGDAAGFMSEVARRTAPPPTKAEE